MPNPVWIDYKVFKSKTELLYTIRAIYCELVALTDQNPADPGNVSAYEFWAEHNGVSDNQPCAVIRATDGISVVPPAF